MSIYANCPPKGNLLCLDLSTKATGWSLFDFGTKELIYSGVLTISHVGQVKHTKLAFKLIRLERMAEKVYELKNLLNPNFIVIEEITGSKNRLGQKLLDGLHWVTLQRTKEHLEEDKVFFYDVSGKEGWRKHIKLVLSADDKKANKVNRKANKARKKGTKKLPVIGPKHLACRFANNIFDLGLDCEIRKTDGDLADAVCIGYAFLQNVKDKGII